tara:strand:+ start:1822 stop:3762 length:1941 start_codon:yes stop_codon:yes gene_type:complete
MEQGILLHSLLMLALAIISIAVFRRLQLPVILAYVFTGLISGPAGFDWFNQHHMHTVAELGIVLLMFSLGLEFSWTKMWAMRRKVFGIGFAQVALTWLLVWCVTAFLGFNAVESLVIGVTIALSSTALVLKMLDEQGWLQKHHGQVSIAVLLFQDLAVVPFFIVLSILGEYESLSGLYVLSTTISATMGVGLFMLVGRFALPLIFDEVAQAKTHELFVLTTLCVALLTGVLTQFLGLSMALGAFMAGMLLGESQYKAQLEADIRPFRDVFMGLFFISIGMLLDLQLIVEHWSSIFFVLIGVLLLKVFVIVTLLRLVKETWHNALATSLCLAQVGEFSFVVLSVAVSYQLITIEVSQILISVAVLSMGIAAYMVPHAISLANFFAGRPSQGDIEHVPENLLDERTVLLLGYGRVGQTIARFLTMEKIPFVALDLDPRRVKEAQAAGENVFFGYAGHRALLKKVGIRRVQLVVLTFIDPRHTLDILSLIKGLAPASHVVVRTQNDAQLDELERAGADQVVPEILEGSLMLVSQILHQCQVPTKRIHQQLAMERQVHYRDLHHFFASDEEEFDAEHVHAVYLIDESFVVGSHIKDLMFHEWKVEIKAVRREGYEIEDPPYDWKFASGDVLLLVGKPHFLEMAEHYIHVG